MYILFTKSSRYNFTNVSLGSYYVNIKIAPDSMFMPFLDQMR